MPSRNIAEVKLSKKIKGYHYNYPIHMYNHDFFKYVSAFQNQLKKS